VAQSNAIPRQRVGALSDDASRAAIAKLHAAWVRAIEGSDASALAELVTDDYEVWANGAAPLTGRIAVTTAMAGALEVYSVEPAFESLELIVSGDWAFERGIERMRVTSRAGGAVQVRAQRALIVLRRDADGRWRYARGMTNMLPAEPTAAPSAG
jgi:uncharacterized protein (TIGR02246 family)